MFMEENNSVIYPIIEVNDEKRTISVKFPKMVISTNVDGLKKEFANFVHREEWKSIHFENLFLDFGDSRMVDSLGLNFVLEILRWGNMNKAKISSVVSNGTVYLVFLNVRLDKQMQINYTGKPIRTHTIPPSM